MDESGSVGDNDFDEMKTFVSDLVARLDVNSGFTRVGVVSFATAVDTAEHIDLDDYTTVAQIQSAIAGMSYTGGWTNTHLALEYVRTSMLTAGAGDRSDVQNVVVVLTDGESTDPDETLVCTLLHSMISASVSLSVNQSLCHATSLRKNG